MKRTVRIVLLAILGFAIILLVRFPAAWARPFLPADVACSGLSGTVWRGYCSGLQFKGAPVGNLEWQLRPLSLLKGKPAAFVDLTRGSDFVRGEVEAGGGGNLVARDLQAQFPLDPPIVPGLPVSYSGTLSMNIAYLRVENRVVEAIEGRIDTTALTELRTRTPIGSYSVVFFPKAAEGEPVGEVTSVEAPVDFRGTSRLTREPGWAVSGRVRVKPETPPRLAQQLAYLGTPDPDGTRQFDGSGTF